LGSSWEKHHKIGRRTKEQSVKAREREKVYGEGGGATGLHHLKKLLKLKKGKLGVLPGRKTKERKAGQLRQSSFLDHLRGGH